MSRGEAYASVAFGVPNAEMMERANNPVMPALMLMEEGQIIPQQGAVPIKRGNELLGAVGVSGARSEEDAEVARGVSVRSNTPKLRPKEMGNGGNDRSTTRHRSREVRGHRRG